jgi:hypothetical protein
MRWFVQDHDNQVRHREQDEQNRKHEEATRMVADLFIRHNGMKTADVISELERIHRFYLVPGWAPSGEQGG